MHVFIMHVSMMHVFMMHMSRILDPDACVHDARMYAEVPAADILDRYLHKI